MHFEFFTSARCRESSLLDSTMSFLPYSFVVICFLLPTCCFAGPQAGQAIKQEYLRQAAMAVKAQSDIDLDKAQEIWSKFEEIALSQGEFGLMEELHEELELEVNRVQRPEKLIRAAIRFGDAEAMERLLQKLKPEEYFFRWLMDEVETIAWFDTRSAETFDSIVAHLRDSDAFLFRSIDDETAFRGAIRSDCIDQLRIRFIHGLIESGKFMVADDQIEKLNHLDMKSVCRGWWLANLPLHQVAAKQYLQTVGLDPSTCQFQMIEFAKAYRSAKSGETSLVLDWANGKHSCLNAYAEYFVLKALIDKLATDPQNKPQITKVLSTAIPALYSMWDIDRPSIDFGEYGSVQWQVPARQHLGFLIERVHGDKSGNSLAQLCSKLDLMGEAVQLSREFEEGRDRELWLIALVHELLNQGKWKEADQIEADYQKQHDWTLIPLRSRIEMKFIKSMAKSGDLEAAHVRSLELSADNSELASDAEFVIAFYRAQIVGDDPSRLDFKRIVDQRKKELDDILEECDVQSKVSLLFDLAMDLDERFNDVRMTQPFNSFFAAEYDKLLEKSMAATISDFKFSMITNCRGLYSRPLTTPGTSVYSLVHYVHDRAKEHSDLKTMNDFAFVEADLHVRNACYQRGVISPKSNALFSLKGKTENYIELARNYAEEGDNLKMRQFALHLAMQKNEDEIELLLESIPNINNRLEALAAAATYFAPHRQPLRPNLHAVPKPRFSSSRVGGRF